MENCGIIPLKPFPNFFWCSLENDGFEREVFTRIETGSLELVKSA